MISIFFVQLTIAERIGYWNENGTIRALQQRVQGRRLALPMPVVSSLPVLNNTKQPLPVKEVTGNQAEQKKRHPSPSIRGGQGEFIGGPTQPESQSFSSVNSNNMVDLFTGDFSYNIPLLDVGGYPVNIAYHSGITMDEEASWVGLGWNINPGSVTRNMRGVPDDFNGGSDTMRKVTNIKPNVNIGVSAAASIEILGLPKPPHAADSGSLKVGLGIFHTTYNGWGLEASLNASINAGSKAHGPLSGGLSVTNNSQNGLTINPSLSYKFNLQNKTDYERGGSFTLSSPLNSRTGLKSIHLGLNANAKVRKGNEYKSVNVDDFRGITFSWPTYNPSISVPMTNYNFSFTAKWGPEISGSRPDLSITGYGGKEYIAPADTSLAMPVFGYLNFQNMGNNWSSLTDFNREKEMPYREKPAIPHIAVPSYTYDMFSVSGEGTGGSFRAYRGDIGYIADHLVSSRTISGAASIDLGAGNLVHGGTDLNANYAVTQSGPWQSENPLGKTIAFRQNQGLYEAVYFRNPGEKTINNTAFYDAIGGDDVVAPALDQRSKNSPTILATNTLTRYSGKQEKGTVPVTSNTIRQKRDKRSQVISYLTAAEAAVAGLDKSIYWYEINKFGSRHCEDNSTEDALGVGTGLLGYYFRNPSLSGKPLPTDIRLDGENWLNWEKGYPFPNNKTFPPDHFSVRWLGRLKAPESGEYTLFTHCDDGLRLWVNDSLVIKQWKNGKPWESCKLNLVKDQLYNIRMEFREDAVARQTSRSIFHYGCW